MVTASVRKTIRGVRGTPGEMILSVVLRAMTASRRMLQARYCGMRRSLHRKGSVLSSFSSLPWTAGVLPNSFAAPRNVVPQRSDLLRLVGCLHRWGRELLWTPVLWASATARVNSQETYFRMKSGMGGEHAASNHRLMYTCACDSPQ